MIVQQHLTALGKSGQGKYTADVAARDNSCCYNLPFVIKLPNETHFIATGKLDGGSNGSGGPGFKPGFAECCGPWSRFSCGRAES